jgi:integrase
VIDNDEMKELVVFAANTGCRQGEIINLRWNEVDLKGCRMTLGNREHLTKSKRVRSIPLNKLALEVLEKRKDKSVSELVFALDGSPIDPTRLSKRFKKYVKRAKLNDGLHFHSLRHSFASWLVMQGVSLFQVQKLLGHTTPTTTQIYAHLTNDNLAATVEKLSEPSI